MRILISGFGSIGKRHYKILKDIGVNDFILYRSGKSANEKPWESIKEIFELKELNKLEIDAALITNPTSLHIETAIEIAKYGIPLFIEKPLGRNLEKIEQLETLVKEKNIPVMMGYNLVFHPAIILMKKLIEEEKVGKIISARAQFGTYMPGWHPEEDYKKSYASNSSLGGGVVLTSIHEQNYLTDFFGTVTDVMAMKTEANVTGIDAEEGAEILLKHSSGVVSNIHLNFFQKPYYRNCQLIGTEGTIYWNFKIPEIKIMKADTAETIKLGEDAMELLGVSYTEQMKHFINAVQKKVSPRIELSKGIDDMKVALIILKNIGRNLN